MKSKQNSKKENNSLNKISMLLQKHNTRRIMAQVPNNMPPSTINIDISRNAISSLSGIQRYRSLQVLNISHNNITQFEEFKFLAECVHLRELWIQENPICSKVNYQYGVFCMLNKVITLNGLTFNHSLEQLSKWSRYNGIKLVQFLMQSCVILNQTQKNIQIIDKTNIHRQLSIMRKLFNRKQIQKYRNNQLIKFVNQNMYHRLVLESLQVPDLDQNQIKDIKDYIFDKIIQIGSRQSSQFIANLLTQIQVNGEDEQKQFVNKPKIVHYILKGIIDKHFTFYDGISPSNSISKYEDSKIRHYLSAETALQTIQTGKRHHNGLQSFHFSMDSSYLKIVSAFIQEQIARLLQKTASKQQNHFRISKNNIEIQDHHLYSCQTYQQQQSIKSPKTIYGNSYIVGNILQILQDSIKRIAFRKLKYCRSKTVSNIVLNTIQSSLSYALSLIYKQCFHSIKSIVEKQRSLIQRFNNKKLLKIFKAWRKIKQRKLKLMKNIIKRRIKVDNFLCSLALAKWRMNARAEKIRQMASSIISGTYNQPIPNSKKGIQLAYKRVMSNKRCLL